ncbi:hypothetical protein MSG28_010059, partial [Choristoneura fumiferana]
MAQDVCSYDVARNDKYGRYLTANKDIESGELIFTDKPFAYGPKPDSPPLCLGCYCPVAESLCARCGWPACGAECAAAPAHAAECAVFARARVNVVTFLLEHCRLGDRFDKELVQQVCGILEVNAVEIPSRGGFSIRAVYPRLAIAAHSCVPNIVHTILQDDYQVQVRAATSIKAGQPLHLCYTHVLSPTLTRRDFLLESKFFWCDCPRCADPTELGSHLSTLKCSKAAWLVRVVVMESAACRRRASDAEQSARWTYSVTAECEPVAVKEEPEGGECGVSEAAVAEGLYAGHEVKDEVVIGPVTVQQQDVAFSMQNAFCRLEGPCSLKPEGGADDTPDCTHTCLGEGPRCNRSPEQQYRLTSCFVRLERLPVGDLHRGKPCSSMQAIPSASALRRSREQGQRHTLNRTEVDPCQLQPAGGAGAAPECTHTRPGEGPRCNMSHDQQFQLRSCSVRLERILIEDLPTCDTCSEYPTYKNIRTVKDIDYNKYLLSIMDEIKHMLLKMQQDMAQQKQDMIDMKEDIKSTINNNINEKFNILDQKNAILEKKLEEQSAKIKSLERHIRYKNLVIFGVEECEKSYHELEDMLINIVNTYFKLPCDRSHIEAIRRIGQKGEKIRPVVITFSTVGFKLKVLKNKSCLLNTKYYIKEDYPKDVLNKRKELLAQLQKEKEAGNTAFIKYDKLIVLSNNKNNHNQQMNKRNLSESPEIIPPHSGGHKAQHDKRICILEINLGKLHFAIIQAYAPTESSTQEEIDKFYNDLEKAHNMISTQYIIAMGDFNAQIGKPKSYENKVAGIYGFGKRSKRGERLMQLGITKGAKCREVIKKTPVFFMPPLLSSADTALEAGVDAGLPYLISDDCFDTWVGNPRGTYYGRRHIRLDPDKDKEFWEFSVDEIGTYDIPAMIDYVSNKTGEDKITKGAKCKEVIKKTPVFFMPPLLSSADTALEAGVDAGLPYLISDDCFDTWVGNARGTYYGRRHIRLDPDKDKEFWEFSVDEIGTYDIPAMIDYVSNKTGEDKLGITKGAKCKKVIKKTPVFFMPPLLSSADTALEAGVDAGLPYLISDDCFDTWVGNPRGTYYGRRHIRLDPDRDKEFWEFSVDEIGTYDIPAMVDYVSNKTGED